MARGPLLLALLLAGCAADDARKKGATCNTEAPCDSGFCYAGTCLDPAGDDDNDGLTNEVEAFLLGTDPTSADTDGDGITDLNEVGPDIDDPDDSDGDHVPGQEPPSHDAVESTVEDSDGDCVPDQFDPHSTSVADLVAALCPLAGVCETESKALGILCSETEVDSAGFPLPRCDLSDLSEAWEDSEATCDGLDNDCDGHTDILVDEGCDADTSACTAGVCGPGGLCEVRTIAELPYRERIPVPGVGLARDALSLPSGFVLLAAGPGGLLILTDPDAGPLGPHAGLLPEGDTQALAASEAGRIWLAAGAGGLVTAQVGEGGGVAWISTLPTPIGASFVDVATDGDHVYVAGEEGGLLVLDAVSGELLGTRALGGGVRAVAANETLVAAAVAGVGVVLLDPADPMAAPTIQGGVEDPRDVLVDGDQAWCAAGAAGLVSVHGQSGELGSSLELGGPASTIASAGSTAWVGLEGGGVIPVDLASSAAPEAGELVDGGGAHRAVPAGNQLLLLRESEVGIRTLAAPEPDDTSTLELGEVNDVVLDENEGYWFALGTTGLGKWTPGAVVVSSTSLGGAVVDLEAAGATLWAAASKAGLIAMELGGGSVLSTTPLAGEALSVSARAGSVLVALGDAGVARVDATSVELPVVEETFALEGLGGVHVVALDADGEGWAGTGSGDLVRLSDGEAFPFGEIGALEERSSRLMMTLPGGLILLDPASPGSATLVPLPGGGGPTSLLDILPPAFGAVVGVGRSPAGLWIVDASSDPPFVMGTEDTPTPTGGAVRGQEAVLSLGPFAVSVRDRTCPPL